jgi:hypothetical protein
MRRRGWIVAAIAAVVLVVGGCSSGGPEERVATPGDAGEPSFNEQGSEASLPEGLYRTEQLTRDDIIATLEAADMPRAGLRTLLENWQFEDSISFALRLQDGRWTQYESIDGGPDEVGWEGTYEVVDEHTVVATDPCGPITYRFTLHGTDLTLDVVDDACGGEDLLFQTAIFETAPFTQES